MKILSWVEYQSRLQEKDLVLPCGVLEQHVPHLPLGTDGLLSGAIAQAVAERVNGLVAPTLSYCPALRSLPVSLQSDCRGCFMRAIAAPTVCPSQSARINPSELKNVMLGLTSP